MATLNTLRTRFGVVLSAVIAFALLAFVFSLKAEMGFSGNDPVVAEINGQDVTYSEYLNEYNSVQLQSGVSEVDEQQAEMLYSATWQNLLSKHLLQPGFEDLGINVSEAERMAIIRGEVPTQALYSIFGNPTTGEYDINLLNNFLFTSQGNPEAEAMWSMVVNQALMERSAYKYAILANIGVNLNDLEVADGVEAANNSFSGRWAGKRYSDVSDSSVSVSDADIKRYYDENKSAYKRQPTRSLSYVEFNLSPSQEDMASVERSAMSLGAQFSEAGDIRSFIRENRSGSVASNYVSEAGLPSAASSALVAGEQYGPINNGANWTMSRVEDSIYASDTLTLSHIVLSYSDAALADSLLVALRKGTDHNFAEAAAGYSLYSESAQNGGSIGEIPFSAFVDDFAAALAPVRKGDIVKVESGDMIQIIKATDVGPRVKHYRVATIDLPILPSQATRSAVYNAAGMFVADAKGGEDSFKSAAANSSVSLHNADITPSMRSIAPVGGSREIAQWAHRAKRGDLSEIFKVDDGYVVAMLTDIDDSEYSSLSDVEGAIKSTLVNNKKFEMLSSQLSGSTFEAQAESLNGMTGEFADVTFGSFYIPNVGVEPRLVGAIAKSKEGVVSTPVKGNSGMYIYVVDSVEESDEPQTVDAEKLRAEATQQQMFQQMLFSAIEFMADVKDLRGETL